jgi:hypothetical protein
MVDAGSYIVHMGVPKYSHETLVNVLSLMAGW